MIAYKDDIVSQLEDAVEGPREATLQSVLSVGFSQEEVQRIRDSHSTMALALAYTVVGFSVSGSGLLQVAREGQDLRVQNGRVRRASGGQKMCA